MRISDWSSDVCSSDLHADAGLAVERGGHRGAGVARGGDKDGQRSRVASRQASQAGGEEACADILERGRSEERRVGKECVRTCRSRGSPSHSKKKKKQD